MQQLSESQWHGSAADTDKSLADNPGMMLSSLMRACVQDEEQLKLSTQQAALLKQQLSEAQSQASAAEKEVQGEQMHLQRLERRLATLQTQAEDQSSQTR